MWRLCRGCIPTRRRLLERYVDCDVHCPLCEDEVEDDVHTFFTCVFAQSSWQAAGLSSVLGSATCQHGSAAERVFALCQNEDYATIGRVRDGNGRPGCGFDTYQTHTRNHHPNPNPNPKDVWVTKQHPRPHPLGSGFFHPNPNP
ncbi:unnamed protein product [Trifolium pratense]|uniref:Uncharacterized protein n=1 Tax=Trifolium pratense TaxID=57577 RepID=A0ACB0KMN6_TRIPR|nr:unnamed protein product [Trifolium pratense]